MNNWKKVFSFLICISLLFSLCACGPRKENGMYDEAEYRQYHENSYSDHDQNGDALKKELTEVVLGQSTTADEQGNVVDAPEMKNTVTEDSFGQQTTQIAKDIAKDNQKSTPKQSAKKNTDKKSSKKSVDASSKKSSEKKKHNKTETSTQQEYATTETTTQAKAFCSLTIDCSTILNNKKKLKKGKESLIPANGIILQCSSVEIQESDTVMDILIRELKANGIALEYTYSPIYKTDYVEGINNIYQMDCGSLSGWMYEVNGSFPNYGASTYKVQDGDQIGWHFTCNGGSDV